MAIPGFQDIMLPLLRFAGDDKEHHIQEAYKALADEFNLTNEERVEMVPSRPVPKINDRVAWARTYLVQACLLESTRRAHFQITERGKEVLGNSPEKIDVIFLKQYLEFREFLQRKKKNKVVIEDTSVDVAEDEESSSETSDALVTRVPDFQTLMLPLLKFMEDGQERYIGEARKALAQEFDLTDEDLAERIPSGLVSRFNNRVGWARTYMTQAGLLKTTRRAYFCITEEGQKALSESLDKIDIPFLRQYEKFRDFQQRGREEDATQGASVDVIEREGSSSETPDERLASAYEDHREIIEYQLLEMVKSRTPDFFEKLAVKILSAMGYGEHGEARVVGGPGDGGIDGEITQDKLGLDIIYIQAKRWENVVDQPEIHKFVGALIGKGSGKGVFMTTSSFTRGAKAYAESNSIILIDGKQIVEFMFDYDVGVLAKGTYKVKGIDPDFDLLDLDPD